jgi:cupin superfamily acireductone dioxygenase involved in methionine salvage
MATISIPDEHKTLTNVDDIRTFLAPFGISYKNWRFGRTAVTLECDGWPSLWTAWHRRYRRG